MNGADRTLADAAERREASPHEICAPCGHRRDWHYEGGKGHCANVLCRCAAFNADCPADLFAAGLREATLRALLDRAEAEIAILRRERDEARVDLANARANVQIVAEARERLRGERDEARAEVERLKAEIAERGVNPCP